MPNTIFVFGSNLAGRHGAGSAKQALQHYGAKYGQGIGLQGRSYAIPTKDEILQTLPLHKIHLYVQEFLTFARNNPHLNFQVVAIGCGLAGYKPDQIAPMFQPTPDNVRLPNEFKVKPPEEQDDTLLLTIIARSIGRTTGNDNYHARALDVLQSIRSANLSIPQPSTLTNEAKIQELTDELDFYHPLERLATEHEEK